MTTYVLQHTHDLGGGLEHVKLIGAYTSKRRAQAAKTRLRRLPGFSEAPNGFAIEELELDKDHWEKGYSVGRGETDYQGGTLLPSDMSSTTLAESACSQLSWTENDEGRPSNGG